MLTKKNMWENGYRECSMDMVKCIFQMEKSREEDGSREKKKKVQHQIEYVFNLEGSYYR
jgi:hypothetical protein